MPTITGEREILERLRGDEATLEREIAAATDAAAATVDAARRTAERTAASLEIPGWARGTRDRRSRLAAQEGGHAWTR